MYQTDQSIRPSAPVELGIEARSILKSIQTEHSKLKQSSSVAQSDLHYFRARFNYYRLSLTRLMPKEREALEPYLGAFYEEISALEAGHAPETVADRPTPFLEAVETPAEPSPVPVTAPESRQTEQSSPRVIDQLKLLQLALEAEPSKAGNQLIARQLASVVESLKSSS